MATRAGNDPSSFSSMGEGDDTSLNDTLSTTGSSSGMSGDPMGEGGGSRSAMTGQDDLLARVVRGAHETVDRLAESAAPHVQRLQEGMSQANDKLHERSGQMR